MYVIVAGGGIVGRNITKQLNKNHDIVVIDSNREACEHIYSKYGAVSIHGSATNINVVKDAGIETCDYALAVMPRDEDNLLFALLAKNFGVKHIFVRMRDPDYEEAYKLAGATNIGRTVQMMVKKFVWDIDNPEIRRVASLRGGKAEVSIVTIPDNSRISGMTVSDIVAGGKFPQNCLIAGIFDQEKDELIIPRGHTQIISGNQVFLIANRDDVAKAFEILRKKKT